jgi:ABC-type Na+ efflux pump permease subunit
MDKQIIKTIVKKDIKAVFSSIQIWLPMILIPLLFVVLIPIMLIIFGKSFDLNEGTSNFQMVSSFLNNLPESGIKTEIENLGNINQKIVYLILNYMFVPMFLIIPVMVSSIISANSFVGEKERKTLETLLFSPASEFDLFFAKILAAFIPTMTVSLLGFLLYGIVIDTLGYTFFNKLIFPTINWLFVMLWLIPAISIFAIFLSVYISTKVKGFQEATQLSAMLVIPLVLLIFGQVSGVLFLSSFIIIAIGTGLFLLDAFLINAAVKSFNREILFKTQIS